MVDTAQTSAMTTTPRKRRTRWILIAGGSLLALVVVFHLAGGWYFSNELISSAFVPEGPQLHVDATVVAVDADTVTLSPVDESEQPATPGTFGLHWSSGYGQISGEPVIDGDTVIRSFTLLTGSEPATGVEVDVQGFAFPSDPQTAFGLDYEVVQYDTPLGEMDAWLVPGDGATTWAVVVHGKGVDEREALRMLPTMHEQGITSLVIRYRGDEGQPMDPSGNYRYGVAEWEDVHGAVLHAVNSGAEEVVLVGYSTGAAVASSFLFQSDLADVIDAVVFDAPNIDLEQAVDLGASQRSLPVVGGPIPGTLVATAKALTAAQLDFSWSEFDYLARADEYSHPMLVFHGTPDETVPVEVSRTLAETRPDLVTYVETSGEHVGSWNADPVAYEDALGGFLTRVLR